MSYDYDGFLIKVNGDKKFYLEVGSLSDEITISIHDTITGNPLTADSSLTLTPYFLNPEINTKPIIYPTPVIIKKNTNSATFKIAA